jgi:hypothetical protein
MILSNMWAHWPKTKEKALDVQIPSLKICGCLGWGNMIFGITLVFELGD